KLTTVTSDVEIDNNLGWGIDQKEQLEIEYTDTTSNNPYFISHLNKLAISQLGYSPTLAPFYLLSNGVQSNHLIKNLLITIPVKKAKLYAFKYQFDDKGNVIKLDISGAVDQ